MALGPASFVQRGSEVLIGPDRLEHMSRRFCLPRWLAGDGKKKNSTFWLMKAE